MEQQTCSCGVKYWPKQRWAHEKCVNHQELVANVVVNRNVDRHKDKEARKVYLREYMRKRRARAVD
jgi:hypothetical protein